MRWPLPESQHVRIADGLPALPAGMACVRAGLRDPGGQRLRPADERGHPAGHRGGADTVGRDGALAADRRGLVWPADRRRPGLPLGPRVRRQADRNRWPAHAIPAAPAGGDAGLHAAHRSGGDLPGGFMPGVRSAVYLAAGSLRLPYRQQFPTTAWPPPWKCLCWCSPCVTSAATGRRPSCRVRPGQQGLVLAAVVLLGAVAAWAIRRRLRR